MLKLQVTIELEGYDHSKMSASAALRVAFQSSVLGGSIRGWTIHSIDLLEEGNAAFDALRDAPPGDDQFDALISNGGTLVEPTEDGLGEDLGVDIETAVV